MGTIADLEDQKQWLDSPRKAAEENLENLDLKYLNDCLSVFLNLIGERRNNGYDENDDNELKWKNLSEEYAAKFRMRDLYYYYYGILEGPREENIKHPTSEQIAEEMPKISTLISGFRADLNTFWVQIDLLFLEDELAQYMKKGDKLASAEAWAKMVTELDKISNMDTIDPKMIEKLKNEYEQSEVNIEYRKNVEEILDIMLTEIRKMRKQIVEYQPQIYFTVLPFIKAENRLNKLKSDRTLNGRQIEMSDLKRVLDLLFAESRLELLQNEFDTKFEKAKFEHGKHNVDWRAFLAADCAFSWNWLEIVQRTGKFSAKDQRAFVEKMQHIGEAAQIKAAPIKVLVLAKMEGITEIQNDLDLLMTDLITPTNPSELTDQEIENLKQFYDRATKLCRKMEELQMRIGIWNRYETPNEIVEKLDREMTRFLKNGHSKDSWKKEWAHKFLFDVAKIQSEDHIKRMVGILEHMKNMAETAFISLGNDCG